MSLENRYIVLAWDYGFEICQSKDNHILTEDEAKAAVKGSLDNDILPSDIRVIDVKTGRAVIWDSEVKFNPPENDILAVKL